MFQQTVNLVRTANCSKVAQTLGVQINDAIDWAQFDSKSAALLHPWHNRSAGGLVLQVH